MRPPAGATQWRDAPVSSWARSVRASEVDLSAAIGALKNEQVPGGAHIASIEGARCQTAHDLFIEFARALEFPDYFGHNWDAFDECLSDLLALDHGGMGSEFRDRQGVHAKTLVIVIFHANLSLTAECHSINEQQKLAGALQWAASGRGGDDFQRGKCRADLAVIFHSSPHFSGELRDWLNCAGIPHYSVKDLTTQRHG